MNKLILTVISTLALTVGANAFAQGDGTEPRNQRPKHHRGAPAMPVAGRVFHAMKKLDLDDEQSAALRTIIDTMKADLRPVMEATRASHIELKALIDSQSFDEDAVAAIAEKEGDLTAERIMISSRAISDALKLLSDEQRVELKAMAKERKERWDERRKYRQKGN